MYRADLERFVDGKLRQLPLPHAPETLVPRVMAAVRAWVERPWYQRAWFTWPLGWQVASGTALVLTLLAIATGLPWMTASISGLAASALSGVTAKVPDVPQRLEAASSAAEVLWHGFVHPVLVYAFVVVGAMCAMCLAVAVALNRVVFGRTAHS
jgi:hypothetical protein